MKKALSLIMAVVMLFSIFSISFTSYAADSQTTSEVKNDVIINVKYEQTFARSILDSLNKYRTTNGCKSFNYDYDLEKVAMKRVAEISLYTSHMRTDNTPWYTVYDEFDEYKDISIDLGENIAAAYYSAAVGNSQIIDDTMKGWKNSESHKANILTTKFNTVGLACVKFNDVYYIVAEFGGKNTNTTKTSAVNSSKNITLSLAEGLVKSLSVDFVKETVDVYKGKLVSVAKSLPAKVLTNLYWNPENKNSVKVIPEVKIVPKYTVANTKIATVSGNNVKGIAVGTTKLTASVFDGGSSFNKTSTVSVVVTECKHANSRTVPARESTCSEQGNNEYKVCLDCGDVLSGSSKKLPLLPHGEIITTKTKANLTTDGKIVDTCSVCKEEISVKKISRPATIVIKSGTYIYDGKVKTPTAEIKDANGKLLTEGKDYTTTCPSDSKNIGTYEFTIKFKGDYTGSKTLSYTIKPKSTSIGLTAAVRGFKVSWAKISGVTGYEIQYATKSDFSNAATVKCSGAGTLSKTITGRALGTKYYVRVRPYKKLSDGSVINGSWSGSKNVKTKVDKVNNKSVNAIAGGFNVKWAKLKGVTGFQVQYATNTSFKNATAVYGGSATTTSKIVKNLKRNKVYYVRVRAYKKSGSTTTFGAWSNYRKVKTK